MDWYDCLNRATRTAAKRPSRILIRLTPGQVLLERGGAHVVGPFIDVDEFSGRPRLADGFYGRNERVGNRQDRVGVADTRAHQCKAEGVGAAGNTDAVPAAAVLCEFLFK